MLKIKFQNGEGGARCTPGTASIRKESQGEDVQYIFAFPDATGFADFDPKPNRIEIEDMETGEVAAFDDIQLKEISIDGNNTICQCLTIPGEPVDVIESRLVGSAYTGADL